MNSVTANQLRKCLLISPSLVRNVNMRTISTSKKKSENIIVVSGVDEEKHDKNAIKEKKPRNWQTYGWDLVNEVDDLNAMHSTFFFSVSIGLVFFGWFWVYYPDANNHDWFQREAYLELRRRETQGLPLIDPNYADPAKLNLPSDDELGDFDIIV